MDESTTIKFIIGVDPDTAETLGFIFGVWIFFIMAKWFFK